MKTLSRIGGLDCTVVDSLDGTAKPRLVVVLCHGYGAPGTDLVNIGPALLRAYPQLAETTQFVFPQAPLTLDHLGMRGGRAWWHLDVSRLINAVEKHEFRDLTKEDPPGLSAAREKLLSLLDVLQGEQGIPMSRIVLGGFSQGAMLTTDVSLRLPEPPGSLCIWSGTLLCEDQWRALAARRGSLRVLQSHGYDDPILPFEGAKWLRDMLLEGGSDVNFLEFPGTHEIPNLVLQRTAEMLLELVQRDR